MKHYIIAKFKSDITKEQKDEMLPDIKEIFGALTSTDGIHAVCIYPNCVDRANRADIMIEIDMDAKALGVYDQSAPHKLWKEKYGALLESKTIFDRD